jgi:L-fucose isomerase-like protein
VPILIHAFPDELDKMGMAQRRDAFCGKFAMMNLFTQYKIPFTVMTPHAVLPDSPEFRLNIDTFDRICRVHSGMKKMNVGAFGARTTPFKAVRFDETTLQNHGISTETFDLSDIFARVRSIKTTDTGFINKADVLENYASWENVPRNAFENMTRLALVIDQVIEDYSLDAIAVRCWIEIQKELDISPCIILSELNNRGIAAACELDVSSAVAMHALKLASGSPCACFDWNNNYGNTPDKCIMFHCGPAPKALMQPGGIIEEHAILKETSGGCGTFGCYTGRLKSALITYAGAVTFNGKLSFYIDEGKITDDPIPKEFFGCAGVAEVSNLQNKLKNIGYAGFRHHVAVTNGNVAVPLKEAFTKYLHYNVESDIN